MAQNVCWNLIGLALLGVTGDAFTLHQLHKHQGGMKSCSKALGRPSAAHRRKQLELTWEVARTCQCQPHSHFHILMKRPKMIDYQFLELDGIIMVTSKHLLFPNQEINWPMVTKLVSNRTFMKI